MKILIVNRFFGGAQIPTGRMAEDVARVSVASGHQVIALASSGEYAGAEKQGQDHRTTGLQDKEAKRPRDEKTSEQRPEIGSQKSENGNGTLRVETVRIPKWMPRALAWLWFTWQARKRIPRMDWEVCVLMTDPPLLPLLAARLKDQKTKRPKDERAKAADGLRDYGPTGPRDATRRVAVWLMDLYPEALAASGRIPKSNPLYRWYFNKRQRALAAADLLICLGEAQKALVERYEGEKVGRWEGSNKEQGTGDGKQVAGKTERPNYRPTETRTPPLTQCVRTAVVPPWDDRGNISLAADESLRNLALYAGNLGEAHCFEEILAAVPHLPGDWTIRFAARGAKLAALKAAASGTTGLRDHATTRQESEAASELKRPKDKETNRLGATADITGYASEEETPGLLASARVHLITMSLGWEGIVVPSKLYGCIRTGRPVLFIGPENADTAREIRANDWGKVLPSGASGEEVAAAILELAVRPTRAADTRNGAREITKLLETLATE